MESWGTRLQKTLRTSASHISSCWSYRCNRRDISDFRGNTICIFARNANFWCFTLKLFVWREGDIALRIYFELTNFGNFFHICTCIKDWRAAGWESYFRIASFKSYTSLLNLALRTFCLISSSRRSHSGHSRSIFGLSYCTVDICTAEFNFRSFTYKGFDWSKGDITLSIHFELTDFGNFFHIRAGVKDWRAVFWETNLRTSWFKSNLAFLNLTLWAFCLSTCCSWSHFLNSRRVLSCHRSAILIYTLNNNWVWCTNILLVRCESDRSIWCHFKDTDIWNNLALASIVESRRSVIIQWYIWVATDKVWLTSLWTALFTSAGDVCPSWSYSSDCRLVDSCSCAAIPICTSNPNIWRKAFKLFLWSKGYISIHSHFKLTNSRHFFNSRTIVEEWSGVSWKGHRLFLTVDLRRTFCEADFSSLNLTLYATGFSIRRTWCCCFDISLIGCYYFCSIDIYSLDSLCRWTSSISR